MEPIVSSETSAIRTQTPGNYPKRNKLDFIQVSVQLNTTLTNLKILLEFHTNAIYLTKFNDLLKQKPLPNHRKFFQHVFFWEINFNILLSEYPFQIFNTKCSTLIGFKVSFYCKKNVH